VPAAARAPPGAPAAAALRAALDAPAVDAPPALRAALDASSPRRAAMVDFWANFGAPGAAAATEARFAEDFRRARAAAPVLADAELRALGALARDAPRARALTHGPRAAPSWAPAAGAAGAAAVWLSAATAPGALMLPPGSEAHARASAARVAARPRLEAALRGEDAGGDAAAAAAAAPRARVAATPAAAEAAHSAALLARVPAALGLAPPPPPGESFAVASLLAEVALYPARFSLALDDAPRAADAVSLPLERPAAVAAEVLAALRDAGVDVPEGADEAAEGVVRVRGGV